MRGFIPISNEELHRMLSFEEDENIKLRQWAKRSLMIGFVLGVILATGLTMFMYKVVVSP